MQALRTERRSKKSLTAALFADRQIFSCEACFAAPQLQELNGCHDELEKPIAVYGKFEYRRCPLQIADTMALRVATLHAEGYFVNLNGHQQKLLPAQLFEALNYVRELLDRRGDDG